MNSLSLTAQAGGRDARQHKRVWGLPVWRRHNNVRANESDPHERIHTGE